MNIYGSVIQNLVIQDYTFVPSGNVGNTQSTVSVTYNGTAASGTANGSPFTPASVFVIWQFILELLQDQQAHWVKLNQQTHTVAQILQQSLLSASCC
jgi:hypothetical protein